MRVLILSGGARRGNTFSQCQSFSSALPDGWECVMPDLYSMDIRHCTGCDACGEGGCIHDDDMTQILESFDSSDVIVFATPVRFNGPSSMLKTVIDRFQVLWRDPSAVSRRRRFMTYIASSGTDNPDLRPCSTIFRSFCLSFGGEWIEPHVFKGTDASTEGMAEAAAGFARQLSRIVESSTERSAVS